MNPAKTKPEDKPKQKGVCSSRRHCFKQTNSGLCIRRRSTPHTKPIWMSKRLQWLMFEWFDKMRQTPRIELCHYKVATTMTTMGRPVKNDKFENSSLFVNFGG